MTEVALIGAEIEGLRRRVPLVQEREEFVHPPENFAMMHKGQQTNPPAPWATAPESLFALLVCIYGERRGPTAITM